MPATLADVARRAQVSKSTVSNVVRGSDVVAPATRRRVEDAIRELRYRPDGVARALRRRSTGLIGLVVPDAVNPFYAQLAVGIERELRRFGHGLVMANTDGDSAVEAAQLEALLERRADGVIIGGLTRGSRLERRLNELGVPGVLAAAQGTGSPDWASSTPATRTACARSPDTWPCWGTASLPSPDTPSTRSEPSGAVWRWRPPPARLD